MINQYKFFNFINDITKCSNQFQHVLNADDSTISTCKPGDTVMDPAELINNELKYLNRSLKSDLNKTKCMLFSFNKNVNLTIIKIGNKKIMKFLLLNSNMIHLGKNRIS